MQNHRVLVTGGAGFIGSNLANHLAEHNEVTAVDDGYLGTPENLNNNVNFVEQSVVDDELPTDVDVVFHFAALTVALLSLFAVQPVVARSNAVCSADNLPSMIEGLFQFTTALGMISLAIV